MELKFEDVILDNYNLRVEDYRQKEHCLSRKLEELLKKIESLEEEKKEKWEEEVKKLKKSPLYLINKMTYEDIIGYLDVE